MTACQSYKGSDRSKGFTLVEMAVVLVIISLLLGGLLMPLSTQIESEKRTETETALEAVKEALIGYAMLNGRLPCPDTTATPNGLENSPCTVGPPPNLQPVSGTLPWATLGLGNTPDAWFQNLGYTVIQDFTTNATTVANDYLNMAGWANNLVVFTAFNCGGGAGALVANNVPAIVVSTGKPRGATSVDENENTDGDGCFVTRTYSTVTPNEFDDILTWISPNTLYTRMVSSGQLP